MRKFDINADVGEGMANEDLLFPYLDSCSIACAGHYGDENTIANSLLLAQKHGVKAGAHPSYPDKEGFGRKTLDISEQDLLKSLRDQLQLFKEVADHHQIPIHHVKAHGALYNDMTANSQLSHLFLDSLQVFKQDLKVYVPYGSALADSCRHRGLETVFEVFGDRNYMSASKLAPRSKANAVIKDPHLVWKHVSQMIGEGEVVTLSGKKEKILGQTVCIHGDNVQALPILRYLASKVKRKV